MAAASNPSAAKKRFSPGVVISLCTVKTIRVIKSKLNPSQLKRFEDSCFGKIFLMSTKIKLSSQTIHSLLLRRADHPGEDDEMWFDIGGKTARFSRYEFALITGLNCGECPEGMAPRTTCSRRLEEKYFRGLNPIDIRCLKRQFLSCSDEEDAFRLSLVYFLEAVLLSRNLKAGVDPRWLSLVDDLESFDKFPWGKLCYEVTSSYLKKAIKAKRKNDLVTNKVNLKSVCNEFIYTLGGFPYAFQVWAFEAIPLLASKYAKKTANLIPRVLCWETLRLKGHKELAETVFSSKNLDVSTTLRATELESKQDYMKNFVDDENFGALQHVGIKKFADSAETNMAAKLKFSTTSITSLSSLNAIRIIKGKLNALQKQRFEASCFGKLFNIPTSAQLSRRIIRQLLSTQADDPVQKEIWFVIGGQRARFSQYEFALVTGLNCGQYPSSAELKATTRSTRLKDKYFDGRNTILRKFLKRKFLSCTDEDDTFKLAMIYFLETVLLGRCQKTPIDQRWLSLIDDFEAFNYFPWGKLSYERTLCSFKTAGTAKLRHYPRKDKNCYKFSGFPYAFQAWIYEAIPSIARKYADRKKNIIPRVLRWECKKSIKFMEIDKNIFEAENGEVVKTLEASVVESEQDYMKTIAEFTCMFEENDEGGEDRYRDSNIDDDATRCESMAAISWSRANRKRTTHKRKMLSLVTGEILSLDPFHRTGKEYVNDLSESLKGMSWSTGKRTSRKRRKMESRIPFSFSEPLKKQTPLIRETVSLDPIHKMSIDDVNDLLEWLTGYRNDTGCLQAFVRDCLGKHDSFINNGEIPMDTEQEHQQQQSIPVTEKQSHSGPANDSGDIGQPDQEVENYEIDAFVCDQPPKNSYPLSMGLLEQVDAILQHELDLDFSSKQPPSQPEADLPAMSLNQSHFDIEMIELSDDD